MGANVWVPPIPQTDLGSQPYSSPCQCLSSPSNTNSFTCALSVASRAYNSPWLDHHGSSFQCLGPCWRCNCTPHFLPHGEKWTSTKSFFALLGSSGGQIQNTGSCQRRGLKSFATLRKMAEASTKMHRLYLFQCKLHRDVARDHPRARRKALFESNSGCSAALASLRSVLAAVSLSTRNMSGQPLLMNVMVSV